MDRNTLLQHLAIAERHVAQGELHLAKQEALICELERHGHDTAEEWTVLSTMRETQDLHRQDRDSEEGTSDPRFATAPTILHATLRFCCQCRAACQGFHSTTKSRSWLSKRGLLGMGTSFGHDASRPQVLTSARPVRGRAPSSRAWRCA